MGENRVVTSITARELLGRLHTAAADPAAQRFVRAMAHGSMSVEMYAPLGVDHQEPHEQDELYIVHSGKATLVIEGDRYGCAAGTCVFVPAGAVHRFEDFTEDFATWVIFWGPTGGEAP